MRRRESTDEVDEDEDVDQIEASTLCAGTVAFLAQQSAKFRKALAVQMSHTVAAVQACLT
jgi:hypothetical protein